MGIVEALLVFTVAAFHLAVMSRCIRADELVLNTLELQCLFKHRFASVTAAMDKPVCEFDTVICLDAFNLNTFSTELSYYSEQEQV